MAGKFELTITRIRSLRKLISFHISLEVNNTQQALFSVSSHTNNESFMAPQQRQVVT